MLTLLGVIVTAFATVLNARGMPTLQRKLTQHLALRDSKSLTPAAQQKLDRLIDAEVEAVVARGMTALTKQSERRQNINDLVMFTLFGVLGLVFALEALGKLEDPVTTSDRALASVGFALSLFGIAQRVWVRHRRPEVGQPLPDEANNPS